MPDNPEFRIELTRETISSGAVRAYIQRMDPTMALQTDEQHRASVAHMLATRPDAGGDVWLFAYGSLIWNPLIEFIDRRPATVWGYHRRYCLWTHRGRGSPDAPGLTLALEKGGACCGVAYRIAADKAQQELELVWRREMVAVVTAYIPTWVRMSLASGKGAAIAFVIDRSHPRYVHRLPDAEVAAAIARAKGPLGTSAAYLFNTVSHLEELGLRDRRLFRLRDRVAELKKADSESPPK
jgi:cation transport protein ChaC